jgi:hypothetical protein
MLSKIASAALLCGLMTSAAAPVWAQPAPPDAQSTPPELKSAPAPDSALTAHFTGFFKTVLAGHVPSSGISSQMRQGFTQQLLAQIDGAFAGLGKFRQLQFVRADSVQQYRRYHYRADFEQGSQPIMFVIDSNNTIVGFFNDEAPPNPQ